VHDREPARAEAAAREFGIPAVAASTGDLLRDTDMLVVLTGVHDALIGAGLAAGRHVFTEKPVTLDIARTRELRRQARAAGLLLEVGAMRACDPALHALLTAVPEPTGGWLVKADGMDADARKRLLPAGFASYTFAADPPPTVPADLDGTQAAALQTLLWEGYHLLTALVIAVPRAAAATCALDAATRAVHATVTDAGGHLYTVVIGRAPAGGFTEQVHLTGLAASATLDFPPPYSPGQSARLTTATGTTGTFADPFTCMWAEVSRHLAGEHPVPGSAGIAERVEQLALHLARATRPATPKGACHA
ncbi:MAG: Gfo/Idh/MocA family oxidoreductase, partial [Streptosporangiaceae bacterium]